MTKGKWYEVFYRGSIRVKAATKTGAMQRAQEVIPVSLEITDVEEEDKSPED